MTTKPFKELPLGATFRFASEATLGWQGVSGPWVKLTPRKYMHEDGGQECRIGTVKALVVEVTARNPQ